jgi:CRP/FNR family cyclic AMP-dependent transcriptional regulator
MTLRYAHSETPRPQATREKLATRDDGCARLRPAAVGDLRSTPACAAFLAQVPLFATLGEDERLALAETTRLRSFKPHEVLFHEGDVGNALFMIHSGLVKIVRYTADGEGTILRLLGSGECMGEMALLDGQPRSATAEALTAVTAVTLDREALRALVARRPELAWTLMSELSMMVRRVTQQLLDTVWLNLSGRMARILLTLAEQYGEPGPQGTQIRLPLTHEELAQMAGAARPTVTLQLREFRNRGLLTTGRDGIIIHRPEGLRQQIEWQFR